MYSVFNLMTCDCKSRVKNEPISLSRFALFIPDKGGKGLPHRRGIQMSMFCLIREMGATPPKACKAGVLSRSPPALVAPAGTCAPPWGGRPRGWKPAPLPCPHPFPLLLPPQAVNSQVVPSLSGVARAWQRGGGGRPEPEGAIPGGDVGALHAHRPGRALRDQRQVLRLMACWPD